MTNIMPGSPKDLFKSSPEIVNYLLRHILSNNRRLIGSEWEFFLVQNAFLETAPASRDAPSQDPVFAMTRALGQKVFSALEEGFRLRGYLCSLAHERADDGVLKITSLTIAGLGTITPEIGHQFEFSSDPCETPEEICTKNEDMLVVLKDVASHLQLTVITRGHIAGFADRTERPHRSRAKEWHRFYEKRCGTDAPRLRQVLDSTASTQVTVDAGAENFHEFFRALLLIEPALTMHYRNSARPHLSVKAFGEYLPSHVDPIIEIWDARTAREAVEIFVERLLWLDVPFLPSPSKPGAYDPVSFLKGRPRNVGDLLREGRLTEVILNNVGGFVLSRPGFRNFTRAVLEVRGIDSQPSPRHIAEVAARVAHLLYDDRARTALLRHYADLTTADIGALHNASVADDSVTARASLIGDVSVESFIQDILRRSDNSFVYAEEKEEFSAALPYAQRA